MSLPVDNFNNSVTKNLADAGWPQTIKRAKASYRVSFESSVKQFSNLETARRRAAFIRWKALENLDKYLIQFEANFIKAGGKVIWAQDAAEACAEIMGIIKRSGAKRIVKSKTNTGQEIGLDDALASNNLQWMETDLGQYILQLSGEKPSHMVRSAIHKDVNSVRTLFSDSPGISPVAGDTEALSKAAAEKIRSAYTQASVGITGANFLLADPGAVAITENEGNIMLAATRPRIHIVIAGIDKVIPSMQDLHVFWPLLANFGTGQKITAYNSIITGPRRNGESDGPEETYVVLIDNGRTTVLAREAQRSVLGCIKCGACLYADPIYSVIGGGAYHSSWMGPPGTVIQPIMEGMKTHGFLNFLSTLSGSDSEVCPVNINFNKRILENRKTAVEQQSNGTSEKLFYFVWKRAMLKREIFNWKNIKTSRFLMNNLFLKSSKGLRTMPSPAKKSFNEMWREKMGG